MNMPARIALAAALLLSASALPVPSFAADGEAVFNSLRCATCHKQDQKAAAAAIPEIAKSYGEEGKLVQFFRGEAPPLIETDKPGMMKGQMSKLKALPEEDQKALAGYILGFK